MYRGAEEMVQLLRVHTALRDDQILVPTLPPPIKASQYHLYFQFQRI